MANELTQGISRQADACAGLGAPFSTGILRAAACDAESGGITAQLLSPWAGATADEMMGDAMGLRLLASLHHLVLAGSAPDLAACYPPLAFAPDAAWDAAHAALADHQAQVAAMLTHEPQTNEVRRSACLLGGFLTIAKESGLPLRCFELGASAGLNSLWDKFSYDIGGELWGDPDSSVALSCAWDGNPPALDSKLTVTERQACDRKVLDMRRADDRLRLQSYCWAEQGERMTRLRAAIALAQDVPVQVEERQAAQWIGRAGPRAGAATVVFHSIVWQYIPAIEQQAIQATMLDHARQATVQAPFFWLRMEIDEDRRQFELRLWEGMTGADRLLAIVHPHGECARWL
ncbi:MAG TPA: DUF2332 domain-containing protein [Sphingobium sp.]